MNLKSFGNALLLLSVLSFSQSVLASSSVWKISKNGDYFYLGGTIHALASKDHPLPQEFTTAYQNAEEIIFETDIDGIESPTFQTKMLQAMLDTSGRGLKGALKPEIYAALKSYLDNTGVPIAQMEALQPWAVSLMISVMGYQQMGLVSAFGVEEYFTQQAKADRKVMGSLETPEEQLGFISSLAENDPNILIEYTLRDLAELPEIITSLKQSWRNGDLSAMQNHPYVQQSFAEFPEMYNTLIFQRNANWIPALVKLSQDQDKEFVMVGALHLPGDKGVLNLLRQQGFKVEQL